MKFNNNLVVNKEHALKARFRYKTEKQVVGDLNHELVLGWNLLKAKIYPRVKFSGIRVSKFSGVPKWKMLSEAIKVPLFKKRSFFQMNKSFVNIRLARTYILRKPKSSSKFRGFRLNARGYFFSSWAKLKDLYRQKLISKKGSFQRKLIFVDSKLGLNSFPKQPPKTLLRKLKLYTFFHRDTRKTQIRYRSYFKLKPVFTSKDIAKSRQRPLRNILVKILKVNKIKEKKAQLSYEL